MARYELDELEADEVYHSLMGRKMDLDARAKSLSEKDGLPEAADAVRKRIEIYMPNGEGDAAKPGLLRLFAPQREIENERQAARGDETRAADGGQDLFGGGAETGGGVPAGQTEPAKPKRTRGRKKGEPDIAPAPVSSDAPPAPETPADPVEIALDQLTTLSNDLLNGESDVEPDIYRGYAVPVLELIPKINPTFDADVLLELVNDTLRTEAHNAHGLGHFVQRQVALVRDAREKPIGRREESHGTTGEASPISTHDESGMPDSTLDGLNVGTVGDGAPEPTRGPDAGSGGSDAPAGLSFAPASET
jgi:hypothetical protein